MTRKELHEKKRIFELIRLVEQDSPVHTDEKISEITDIIESVLKQADESQFLLWAVGEELQARSLSF